MRTRKQARTIGTVVIAVIIGMMPRGAVGGPGGPALTLEEPPRYGMYYDRWEPSFYTGFAPRTLDPERLHLHIGRGNQLRVTVVLSDPVLDTYARDLLARYRTYRTLIDAKELDLTQNTAFEEFERTIERVGIARLVDAERALASAALRERNLRLLEQLNPGRVFRIRVPVDDLIRHWAAGVRPEDRRAMSTERRLELVNRMLPTRLFVTALGAEQARALDGLVRQCPPSDRLDERALEGLRPDFLRLFERTTAGIYPVRDGQVQFEEFTAVYPIGSVNEFTSYRGRQIPLYPTPGRRALTTHQRTKTVEHIPTTAAYSYFPWIPYMHVGPKLHNSIHTLWWKMPIEETSFLPASWEEVDRGSRTGRPYRYLWLLSRGPMSHGCTHLNGGHISELRQILPAETEELYAVDVFLNQSYHYDVFDIDGDLTPEVMGVRYFIAYDLRDKRPHRLRVRNERRAYYDWLYGGELEYDGEDRGYFRHARGGEFVGRRALGGAAHARITLHEAAYEPERIQFYRLVDIPFARELRKVGWQHPFARGQTSPLAAGG